MSRPATPGQTQRDHLGVNTLLQTMRNDSSVGVRRAAMKEVGEPLKRRIRWEESILFEVTQGELTPDELAALGQDIAERIPKMPPPAVWETEK